MAEVRPIYEWEAAQAGDQSPPVSISVTAEAIREYARIARYEEPFYATADPRGLVAPPGMAYILAPMRRDLLINAKGYLAPEQAPSNPRPTPYVASELRLFKSVRPGDTITSITRVHEKYERRGNKYITFLITGVNQQGEKVVEYTYTCLWRRGESRALVPSTTPGS